MSRPGRAALAVATLAAAAACAGSDERTDAYVECGAAPIQPSRVTIVGDSLSVQAQAEYLAAIEDALVDACNGRTIAEPLAFDDGLSRVESLQKSEPDWWVVVLGTNDAAYGGRPPEQTRAHARQLLDAIGPEECVAWVLPAVQSPVSQATIANVAAARDVIRDELGGQACRTVVDWSTAISAEPGLLGDDGVHLTLLGRERLAELVAAATDG